MRGWKLHMELLVFLCKYQDLRECNVLRFRWKCILLGIWIRRCSRSSTCRIDRKGKGQGGIWLPWKHPRMHWQELPSGGIRKFQHHHVCKCFSLRRKYHHHRSWNQRVNCPCTGKILRKYRRDVHLWKVCQRSQCRGFLEQILRRKTLRAKLKRYLRRKTN